MDMFAKEQGGNGEEIPLRQMTESMTYLTVEEFKPPNAVSGIAEHGQENRFTVEGFLSNKMFHITAQRPLAGYQNAMFATGLHNGNPGGNYCYYDLPPSSPSAMFPLQQRSLSPFSTVWGPPGVRQEAPKQNLLGMGPVHGLTEVPPGFSLPQQQQHQEHHQQQQQQQNPAPPVWNQGLGRLNTAVGPLALLDKTPVPIQVTAPQGNAENKTGCPHGATFVPLYPVYMTPTSTEGVWMIQPMGQVPLPKNDLPRIAPEHRPWPEQPMRPSLIAQVPGPKTDIPVIIPVPRWPEMQPGHISQVPLPKTDMPRIFPEVRQLPEQPMQPSQTPQVSEGPCEFQGNPACAGGKDENPQLMAKQKIGESVNENNGKLDIEDINEFPALGSPDVEAAAPQPSASPETSALHQEETDNCVSLEITERVPTPAKQAMVVFPGQYCKLCKSNKEVASFYNNHILMDEKGIVQCPVLRSLVCSVCGATGDYAHTLRYCPEYRKHYYKGGRGRYSSRPIAAGALTKTNEGNEVGKASDAAINYQTTRTAAGGYSKSKF